jgi:sugar lactone lactonase YvrE
VKRALFIPATAAAAIAAALAYLAFWPVGLDFGAWSPPPAPQREGALAPNDRLAGVEWLGRGVVAGPESTATDADGRVVAGTRDGRILRRREDGRFDELAATGGRPLGLAFLPDGSLAVADRDRGLLRVVPAEPGGRVEVLATEAGGAPLGFPNDVAAAPDGTLYFTDATTRRAYRDDFLEHRPRGRLLVRSPDGKIDVLLAGLHFANGVALGPGGAYLVVNETAEYRVVRYWLAGPRKGEAEPLVEDLPGFPDNVTWSPERRVFWIALFSPRVKVLDALLPHPFLRAMLYRLPRGLQPEPEHHAWIVAVDETGRIVESLEHVGADAYAPVTSVREADGWLWLGSLEADGLGRIRAPPLPSRAR